MVKVCFKVSSVILQFCKYIDLSVHWYDNDFVEMMFLRENKCRGRQRLVVMDVVSCSLFSCYGLFTPYVIVLVVSTSSLMCVCVHVFVHMSVCVVCMCVFKDYECDVCKAFLVSICSHPLTHLSWCYGNRSVFYLASICSNRCWVEISSISTGMCLLKCVKAVTDMELCFGVTCDIPSGRGPHFCHLFFFQCMAFSSVYLFFQRSSQDDCKRRWFFLKRVIKDCFVVFI